VTAALTLVDEIGYASVTMRRVAEALDTGPASLYVYVADRDELMAQVYDRALAEVELPGPADGAWRARLELLVSRTIEVLSRHDDIALVALTGLATGPHALRLTEETLRLLREGGVGDATCVWAADLLDQHVISSALERARWRRDKREPDAAARASRDIDAAVGALPIDEFPTLHALRASLVKGGDVTARAEWKLRAIIDGLLAQRSRR
jgi:AcrR family transcriptional regulator